jgi:SAM-dependent methyltransferase
MTTDSWDEFAADWDSNPDVLTYANRAFDSWQSKVSPLMGKIAEARVLDFGCGTGLLTSNFSPICLHVVAVDTSPKMIERLKGKIIKADISNVTTLAAPIDAASILEHGNVLGKFDLVVASSVCSFLPDFESTLREVASIMMPGGIFVQWDWLESMPADKIQSAFSRAGMTCLQAETEFSMEGHDSSMAVVMGIGQLPVV